MNQENINEDLMKAIEAHNYPAVIHCLDAGADPNYTRIFEETESNATHQPTTPLRLVMFCISDNLLSDQGLLEFAKITKLLLQKGADPKPAMQIAEARYGKYNPQAEQDTFMEIWRMVAEAV